MRTHLIAWPYHAGLRDAGTGRGPSALVGDPDFLAATGQPDVEFIPPVDESQPEVARVFELDRRLARTVRATVEAGDFPLVLAGDCVSCLGTTAGAGAARPPLGIVWFDAHADFDTPDDNLSGFTDAMGLAIQTGSGWRALRETIPGFERVREENVVLAGVRDLEPHQVDSLSRSSLRAAPGDINPGALRAALDDLASRVDRVYLHFDLDVIDEDEIRANEFAAPGGPSLEAALAAVDSVFERFTVAAAAITAYDPDVDPAAAAAASAVAARIRAHVAHARPA